MRSTVNGEQNLIHGTWGLPDDYGNAQRRSIFAFSFSAAQPKSLLSMDNDDVRAGTRSLNSQKCEMGAEVTVARYVSRPILFGHSTAKWYFTFGPFNLYLPTSFRW